MSVNSEVPSIHLALQDALLGKPVNTLPPNTLHLLKSLILKFAKNVKNQCGDEAA